MSRDFTDIVIREGLNGDESDDEFVTPEGWDGDESDESDDEFVTTEEWDGNDFLSIVYFFPQGYFFPQAG